MTADDMIAMLRKTYALPEWVLAEQAASRTGYAARRADAVAFNCYQSRGLEIIGFEVKVRRSDWVREMKSPDKAEAVAAYCDKWYVVAPDGIVHDGELPKAWGLMLPNDKTGGVRIAHQADQTDTKPVSRTFLAAIMRGLVRSDETVIAERVSAARKSAYDDGAADALSDSRDGRAEAQLAVLSARVAEFERVSGIVIGHHAGRLEAKAIHAARVLTDDYASNFTRHADQIERFLPKLREALAALETLRGQLLAEDVTT